jgi:hypothetical protein
MTKVGISAQKVQMPKVASSVQDFSTNISFALEENVATWEVVLAWDGH